MARIRKSNTHNKKEEAQAKRVIKIISVGLVLALAMLIGFFFLG